MKWFKTKNEKKIEELTGDIAEMRMEIARIKDTHDKHLDGHAYSASKLDEFLDYLNGQIKTDFSKEIGDLKDRIGNNEKMHVDVFKKAQDTYSNGMGEIVSASTKNIQYAMKIAGDLVEKSVKEIKGNLDELVRVEIEKSFPEPETSPPEEDLSSVEKIFILPRAIINGEEKLVSSNTLTYDQVVELAGFNPSDNLSVSIGSLGNVGELGLLEIKHGAIIPIKEYPNLEITVSKI